MTEPNIILAFPLYKQVSVKWLIDMMAMDRRPVRAHIFTDGVYVHYAMNILVDKAFACDGWDWFVVMEHDMVVDPQALNRIAQYPPECGIVGSVYFKHDAPFEPMTFLQDTESKVYQPVNADTVRYQVENPGLHECDAVGFGFTAIHRSVFEKWPEDLPMFSTHSMRSDDEYFFGSHDLYFCHHAREMGFKVYTDSAIVCRHLTQISVGYEMNQECAKRSNPELPAAS